MAKQHLPEINILNSTRKTLIVVGIIALLFGALYAYLFFVYFHPENEDAKHSTKQMLAIYFGGPVGVLLLFWGIYRAYHPKPVIRINGDYIWWSTFNTNNKDYRVQWGQVVKFELKEAVFGGNILVFVKNPERYYSPKFAERKGQQRFASKYGTHIAIPRDLIEESGEELLAILRNYQDVVNEKPGAKIIPRMEN